MCAWDELSRRHSGHKLILLGGSGAAARKYSVDVMILTFFIAAIVTKISVINIIKGLFQCNQNETKTVILFNQV